MDVSVYALPRTKNGRYSFDVSTGELHEPYQSHAPGAYRTSADGVRNLSRTPDVTLCPICFYVPPPPKRTPTRTPKATIAEEVSVSYEPEPEASLLGDVDLGGTGSE